MVSKKPMDFIRDGLLLFGVVTALGYITTPDNPFLTGVSAHPYFLVVVFMAARYGTAVGMGSATASLLLYLLGGFVRPGEGGALPSIFESTHSVTISGLYLFALIVGSFCDARRRRIEEAESQKQDTKEHLKELERQNEILIQTNRELRDRIMEDATPLHMLFEIAQKLNTLDRRILYSSVIDVIEEHIKAESCSFYLLKEQLLHLVAHKGWDNVLEQDKIIPIDDCHIIKKAVSEKRLVSLHDFIPQEDLAFKNRVMAAPVCSQTDGTVIGVISIEKIPFDCFNPQTLRVFSLIAQWTSKAIADPAPSLSGQVR